MRMQRSLSRNTGTQSASDDSNPMETTLSCLWILTPLMATISLLVVLIAMLTNQWLHTEEKMANASYNGTGEREYLSKFTVSGLWMFCYTNREYTFKNFINTQARIGHKQLNTSVFELLY